MCIYISIIELTTLHINFVFKSQIESQILCVSYSNVVGENQPAGLKSNLFLVCSAYDESTSRRKHGENPLMRINGQFTTLLNLGLVMRDPP